jgi:hypothetical protein
MEWLTVSLLLARFTTAKLQPDHKLVTIESIINTVFGAGSLRTASALSMGRASPAEGLKRNFRIAESFNSS